MIYIGSLLPYSYSFFDPWPLCFYTHYSSGNRFTKLPLASKLSNSMEIFQLLSYWTSVEHSFYHPGNFQSLASNTLLSYPQLSSSILIILPIFFVISSKCSNVPAFSPQPTVQIGSSILWDRSHFHIVKNHFFPVSDWCVRPIPQVPHTALNSSSPYSPFQSGFPLPTKSPKLKP